MRSYPGTTGELAVRRLARDKGLQLYRGHAFGCGDILLPGGGRRQAYTLLDNAYCNEAIDPGFIDSHVLLCWITLDDAEQYLTDGTVPEGHQLYEPSPYLGWWLKREDTNKEDSMAVKRKSSTTTTGAANTGRDTAGTGPPAGQNKAGAEGAKKEAAKQLTKELVSAMQDLVDAAGRVAELAKQAFEEKVWEALGYDSWKLYATAELQTYTEHMSRELLAEINSELILDAGVSANAASAVTGTNDKTAKADAVKAATQRGSESSEPGQSRGADGKSYPRAKPKTAPSSAKKAPPKELTPEEQDKAAKEAEPAAPAYNPWNQVLELLDLTSPLHQVSTKLQALKERGDTPADDFHATVLQALKDQQETLSAIMSLIEQGESLEAAISETLT